MIVKICGITTTEDARAALDAGADWIGLNLIGGGGPRHLDARRAAEVLASLPDASRAVALVQLEPTGGVPADVEPLVAMGLRRVQVYGMATPATTREVANRSLEAIWVLRVDARGTIDRFGELLASCRDHPPAHVLLDAHVAGRLGGTGRTADWPMIAGARDDGVFRDWPPVLLAGGLTPENVAEAIRVTTPAGVDVSSGVEQFPGRKDPARMRAFVRAARSCSA
jgi:phosphoribosylanthranilate isomerase